MRRRRPETESRAVSLRRYTNLPWRRWASPRGTAAGCVRRQRSPARTGGKVLRQGAAHVGLRPVREVRVRFGGQVGVGDVDDPFLPFGRPAPCSGRGRYRRNPFRGSGTPRLRPGAVQRPARRCAPGTVSGVSTSRHCPRTTARSWDIVRRADGPVMLYRRCPGGS